MVSDKHGRDRFSANFNVPTVQVNILQEEVEI